MSAAIAVFGICVLYGPYWISRFNPNPRGMPRRYARYVAEHDSFFWYVDSSAIGYLAIILSAFLFLLGMAGRFISPKKVQ